MGSEAWYEELLSRPQPRNTTAETPDTAKPATPLTTEQVVRWLSEFSELTAGGNPRSLPEVSEVEPIERPAADSPQAAEIDTGDLVNPFPPGYVQQISNAN